MGNQSSFDQKHSEERLLRRNVRTAFPQFISTSVGGAGPSSASAYSAVPAASSFLCPSSPYHQHSTSTSSLEAQRQSRSRSLEPKSLKEIRVLEHSKSARYGPGGKAKAKLEKQQNLWNPEDQRLRVMKEQLMNPNQPQPSLEQFQELQKRFRHGKNSSMVSEEDEELQRKLIGLSSHQTLILQRIWSRVSEKDVLDCAKHIFAHLLRTSSPQVFHFFSTEAMTDKEILASTTFARQSANFAMVLDFVISNLNDDVEKVCFALQCLGERHARLAFPVEPMHWALFQRVFEDNPPKLILTQNPEGHTVWKLMIQYLIRQMLIGYGRMGGGGGSGGSGDSPEGSKANLSAKRLSSVSRHSYGALPAPTPGARSLSLSQQSHHHPASMLMSPRLQPQQSQGQSQARTPSRRYNPARRATTTET